jgi:hypothetical protein
MATVGSPDGHTRLGAGTLPAMFGSTVAKYALNTLGNAEMTPFFKVTAES